MKIKTISYDDKIDAFYMRMKKGTIRETKEVSPGIMVDLAKNGELLGIEVLDATKNLPKLFKEKTAIERFAFA